jgi:hypothetical protein
MRDASLNVMGIEPPKEFLEKVGAR